MIIPKFIYEEMIEIKQKEAYKSGYKFAIERIEEYWNMTYGCYSDTKCVSLEEVKKFFKIMKKAVE